jgi:hypothetical protein
MQRATGQCIDTDPANQRSRDSRKLFVGAARRGRESFATGRRAGVLCQDFQCEVTQRRVSKSCHTV